MAACARHTALCGGLLSRRQSSLPRHRRIDWVSARTTALREEFSMNQKTISRASSSNGDFTRRSLMAGGAFAFGSAVITGTAIAAPDGGIIPARAIHQEELFAAAPARERLRFAFIQRKAGVIQHEVP